MSYIHSVHMPMDIKEHVGRRLMQEVTEPYLSQKSFLIMLSATVRKQQEVTYLSMQQNSLM